ncbi:IPT/TIG domain-containing protein [Janthinobacterium sp. Mn2066]|uniref:IPT/TIG domain-containing protein n=1 Tax=Janthinobacterium sp. Mn2066 TaxID=3395264 RepID=UPI003BDB3F86
MKYRLLVCLFVMLGLSACGGGGGGGGDTVVATSSNSPAIKPAVTAVSASNVAVGGNLVLTGTNLSQVTAFQIAGVTVSTSSVSDTSATLVMPGVPVSGVLSLVSASGTAATSYNVTVYVPLTVSSIAPASGGVGSGVTLTGNGMGAVTAVLFSNGTAATLQSQGANSVALVVPVGAATGPLTVRGPYNDVITNDSYTVLPSVSVTSITTAVSGATMSVTIQGSNLDQVTTATVGNTQATIVSATASQLVLNVPATATGNVLLSAPSRVAVNAGTVSAFTLGSIDFAQVLDFNASDTSLHLTRGKAAAVRVSVLGTQTGRSSPAVTLTATSATGASLGSIAMSGPATLPTAINTYSFNGNFSAVLPASWIAPGLQVRVTAVGNDGTQVSQQATPAISSAAKINLVLVPLSTDDGISQVPDADVIRAALALVYPYAADNITISTRAPLAIAGSSSVDSWWTDIALPALESARANENNTAFYFGFVSKLSASRTAGLAYISNRTTGGANPSALGLDATFGQTASIDPFGNAWPQWLATMVHELGHNHGLFHVNCGSPANPVTDYPYNNGDLGPQPIYSSNYGATIGQLSQAAYASGNTTKQMKDVMSYCSGAWFSDYSYTRIQQFLEKRTTLLGRSVQVGASTVPPENGYLTISGRITPAGVQLRPAEASTTAGQQVAGANAAYTLRVLTASGKTIDVPFDSMQLADHSGSVSHFRVTLANPGDIQDVEVLSQGKPLAKLDKAARRNKAVAATSAVTFDTTQNDGRLALTWDAQTEPYAAVLYVGADGRKQVVASGLTGGAASVDVSALPAGGRFEISLSSSVGGRLMKVQRR